MCQLKKIPFSTKYNNSRFGNCADGCLIGVLSHLNKQKDLATIASCCGHGEEWSAYLTLIQPESKICYIKEYLEDILGWNIVEVEIFNELPTDAIDQLGYEFLTDKVYVGYYNIKVDYYEVKMA